AHAGRFDLLGRLGSVPTVGREQRRFGGDDDDPGRTAEPAQVTNVGQVGHDERVHPCLVEPGAQLFDARGHLEGGQLVHFVSPIIDGQPPVSVGLLCWRGAASAPSSRRRTASIASSYPRPPNPATRPSATGATTEV